MPATATSKKRADTKPQARADAAETSVVREWISGSDELKPVDHRRLLNLRWPQNSFYIPENRLENLKAYRYSGTDKSLVSRYVLAPYWNNLVKLFPTWVAPNVITLTGLAFVFLNVLQMIVYLPGLSCTPKPLHKDIGGEWDPLFKPSLPHNVYQNSLSWVQTKLGWALPGQDTLAADSCPPNWIYFTWALGLFLYQSMDAIDGKQARRTGTSGPLGEMFDHGCDAINTTLEVLLCAAALNLGQSWWTVASQVFTLANFYLTTWEEYHTGTLYLSVFSGPIEGILLIVGLYIITGFKGPSFWDQGILTFLGVQDSSLVQQFSPRNLPLNECFLLFGAFGCFLNILQAYRHVVKKRLASKQDPITPLFGLYPFVVHAGCNVAWLYYAPGIMGSGHLVAFCLYWGLAFAYQVGLLITAYTTKQSFPYFNLMMIVSALGAADAREGFKGSHYAFQTSTDNQIMAMYIALGVSFVVYAVFVRDVIGSICVYLDINCLTVKHKVDSKKSS